MPKSRNSNSHTQRLNRYKTNKKNEQELLKKKMIDSYIKAQQELMSNKDAHTSTEEVVGPDINVDGLTDDWSISDSDIVDSTNTDIFEVLETEEKTVDSNK